MSVNRYRLCLLSLASLLLAPLAQAAGENQALTIGTGSVTGVYYPAGGAICRLVNKEQPQHRIRCSIVSTPGSIYNLQQLRDGRLAVAVVQSDTQYLAFQGLDGFAETGPFDKLRSLFSLHPESLTLVVRQDGGIRTLADLPGKRLDIGNPGSGDRSSMAALMQAQGWDSSAFSLLASLPAAERARALCDGKIDAFAYMVGHPSGTLKEASSSCNIRLLPVAGPAVDSLLQAHPYFSPVRIPAGLYRGADEEVATFGVQATLVTSADLPDEQAYQLVKSVFDNFGQFKRLHPAFALLKKETLLTQGLSAPLHPGALRYYREVGLLPSDEPSPPPVDTTEKTRR